MKFTKTSTPGQCRRMRCKEPSAGTVGDYEICEGHFQETIQFLALEPVTVTADPEPSGGLDLDGMAKQSAEYAESVKGFDPQSSEEWTGLVAVLHDSIDEHETLDLLRKEEGEPHHTAWKAVNDRYRPALDSAKGLVETVKATILEKRLAMEQAQFDAIAEGREVPDLFEDPPGLSFPPAELSIKVTDLAQVPIDFLCTAVDMEKVANALTADPDREIPGIDREWVRRVLFRRPSQ